MENQNTNFETWAIIEVFGHEKYAGFVKDITIGSTTMLQVQVPETGKEREYPLPGFQKIFNPSSIFSLTPVSEEYAREMANNLRKSPVDVYEHKEIVGKLAQEAFDNMKMSELRKLLSNNRLTVGSDDGITEDDLPIDF